MGEAQSSVVILHGEDEFGITQEVAELEKELGDPSAAVLNVTRLDGRTFTIEELNNAARAMPFLAARRLVVVTQPCLRLSSPTSREAFKKTLNDLPATTTLVLVEFQTLGGNHWLTDWARHAGEKVAVRSFSLKKVPAMAKWIQEQAVHKGGEFKPEAAILLASLVGSESRVAYQEIEKLLTYAGDRPVQTEDVHELSGFYGEGNIFVLVDALGHQDGKKASRALRMLLAEQDALQIFAMVVRQFRLLLLSREILEEGGRLVDVAQKLRLPNYVAEKVMGQARHFSLSNLEMVYHKLLELDNGIKTGVYNEDVALEVFVSGFTMRSQSRSH